MLSACIMSFNIGYRHMNEGNTKVKFGENKSYDEGHTAGVVGLGKEPLHL